MPPRWGIYRTMEKRKVGNRKKELIEAFDGPPPNVELADKWVTMTREERAEARRRLGAAPPADPSATPPNADPSASGEDAPPIPAVPSIELIEVQIEALQKKLDTEWATASSAVTDRLRRPVVPKDFPKRAAA